MMVAAPRRPDIYVAARPWGLGDSGGSSGGGGVGLQAQLVQAGIQIAAQLLIGPIKHLITGCGPTCVQATGYANQAEALLKQNLDSYYAQPVPRAASVQAAFLQNADTILNHFQQQCASVPGPAGINCFGDRAAGSCKWKQTPSSPLLKYPGEPQPGECWNWVSGYRDPIAADPDVVPDSSLSIGTQAGDALTSAASSIGVSSPILLLALGGLALWAVLS